MGAFYRKMMLSFIGNPLMKKMMMNYGMKLGASRFVAAESLEDTIEITEDLNARGFDVTLDYLGESVVDPALAEHSLQMILRTLDEIYSTNCQSNISVKLTQLGLMISEEYCLSLMDQIVARAKQYDNFVRIDMEDSSITEQTLRIFNTLLDRYGKNHVGIVLQSYLYRSKLDLNRLRKKGANVRIVKGAYSESKEVAFQDKFNVNREFVELVQKHLHNGNYAAIATHDKQIIDRLKSFIHENNIPRSQFEFQMLYGVAQELQEQLRDEGYRVRIYTPFGEYWYPYFSRRLSERPANMLFILKKWFRR